MRLSLVMRTADGQERSFPVNGERVVLGRHSRCDLRLALPSVDPQHCEIRVDGGVPRVRDLHSSHGTFHNGVRVEQAELSPEDRLTIGPVTFIVRIDLPAHRAEIKPSPRAPAADEHKRAS